MKNLNYILLISGSIILNGCSLFKPYVDPAPLPIDIKSSEVPLLDAAISELEGIQTTIRNKRNETKYEQTTLGLAAFGAATASAVSGMYGAGRDLILMLGLGAAGSYTAGSLWFNDTKIKLYSSADKTLGCVANKGYSASSLVKSLTTEEKVIDTSSLPKNCAEYNAAKFNLKLFKAQDPALAEKVRTAGRKIIGKLNDELEKNEPSLENMASAGKQIGSLGSSFGKPADFSATGKDERSESASLSQPSCDETVKTFSTRVNNAINSAIEQFDVIDSCDLAVNTLTPLVADPSTVNIGKDEEVRIRITGGKDGSVIARWKGNIPKSDQIQFIFDSIRGIRISGKSNITSGSNFDLEILDLASIPNSIVVKVSAK